MDGTSLRPARWVGLLAGLALAACAVLAGCSTYLGTTPKSFLRHVRANPDPNLRYLAYAKLGSADLYDDPADKAEAVETLIAKLQQGREPIATRAVIVRSLGDLGDRRARDIIARVTNDPSTEAVIKVEACRALGKVGHPEDATILARIMTVDSLEDCRIAAIEGIGSLRAEDPRIMQVLVDGMEHDDPAIRLACYRSLRKITAKDLGSDPAAWRRDLQTQLGSSSPAGTPPRGEPPTSKPRPAP
jgi:HEAT repeat protein